MTKALKALGEDIWKNKTEKINAELFTLTYGALVSQLVKDYENYGEVNKQLETMQVNDNYKNNNKNNNKNNKGYNIGVRLIEDFLARSGLPRCHDFRETAEIISLVGFKGFLGITPVVANVSADGKEFSLILEENPLNEFVELPEEGKELFYCNILCGVLRGALEMVQLQVECEFVSCSLQGSPTSEIRVKLVKIIEDEIPAGES